MYIHHCLAEHWLYIQGCQWHRSRGEQQRDSRQQQGSQGEERVPWKSHFPPCFAPSRPLLLNTSIKLQG